MSDGQAADNKALVRSLRLCGVKNSKKPGAKVLNPSRWLCDNAADAIEATDRERRQAITRARSSERLLSNILRHCELNPTGETAFERDVIAARRALKRRRLHG